MTPWELKGREFINCTCEYGCNCQFNALPDKGHCHAVASIQIESGHHGDVSLDGLRTAAIFKWPGPIHEGNGEAIAFLEARADERQREALLRIMTGQDTAPMATMFAVFASTLEHAYDPIFTTIDFDVDVDERRGRVHVEGVFDLTGEPIRNPVTGAAHRVRIDLPHGFEYELAEVGSGTGRSQGNIALTLAGTYAQFARLHLNNHGLIRHRVAA